MTRILIIEDEPSLLLSLKDNLTFEGYDVATETDGNTGCQRALEEDFALVLLDIMLPGLDGFSICRQLKQQRPQLPILILSARDQSVDVIRGLELGADDYIRKPFEMAELLARIRVRLRLQSPHAEDIQRYQFGDISLDFLRFEASKADQPLSLTSREFRILQFFVQHRGEVVSRDALLEHVWGYNAFPSTRTVDNYILRLRKSIEDNPSQPQWLLSIRGEGYRFTG